MKRIATLIILIMVFTPMTTLAVAGPEVTSPENGSRFSNSDTIPFIVWTEIVSASSYEIEFGLDSEFNSVFSLFADETSLDLPTMLESVWSELRIQLFLHVRGMADNVPITEWSEPIEFSKSISGPINIVGPVDDARYSVGDLLPVFQWEAIPNTSSYVLEFASDPDFAKPMGSFSVTDTALDCNRTGSSAIWDVVVGTFYWRVYGVEGDIAPTPASKVFQFSKTITPPTTLLTPLNKSHLSGSDPMTQFTWEPLSHFSPEYHIQFAYDSAEFPLGGSFLVTPGTSFSFESVSITPEMWSLFYGKLKWRVAGLDTLGNHGSFSQPFYFVKMSNNNYMAFGDSITGGYGASDWETGYAGYPPMLQEMLRDRTGQSINVFCKQNTSWFPGGHAYTGNAGIVKAMEHHGPGYVMVMFGIIDIVDPGASGCEEYDCKTIENLNGIITKIRQYNSIPYIATLPPINPISERQFLQDVVEELNVDIRLLAADQSIPLCDLEEAFYSVPLPLEDYFNYDEENDKPDWAHFNDMGYQVIAETWNNIL